VARGGASAHKNCCHPLHPCCNRTGTHHTLQQMRVLNRRFALCVDTRRTCPCACSNNGRAAPHTEQERRAGRLPAYVHRAHTQGLLAWPRCMCRVLVYLQPATNGIHAIDVIHVKHGCMRACVCEGARNSQAQARAQEGHGYARGSNAEDTNKHTYTHTHALTHTHARTHTHHGRR
jgi:hypothetical protein